MAEYAIVKDGVVINRIVSNKKFADEHALKIGGEAVNDDGAQKGYIEKDSKFNAPVRVEDFNSARERILNEIIFKASELKLKGVTFESDQISIDDRLIDRLFGTNRQRTTGRNLKISDTTAIDYNAAQIKSLQDLVSARIEFLEDKEDELTILVNNAVTLDDLSAIDISFD